MKLRLLVKIFMVMTIAFMAVVFLSRQIFASAPAGVATEEVNNTISSSAGDYTSPIFNVETKCNLVGFAWQGADSINIQLRFHNQGNWTEWYSPESTSGVNNDGWQYGADPVMAGQADKIQYRLQPVNNINQVKLICVGEKAARTFLIGSIVDNLFKKVSASSLAIINRLAWQANENWRYNSIGQEVWPAEYQWPEKIVIHHTAGDNGGSNPAAVVRGIYYWHAVVLGWGDIGYNYLIDQQGNIYEGRAGGDGVIGAHAYRDATCARIRFGGEQNAYNFNKGTVGIAVLGDYENSQTVNDAVRAALANLVSAKAIDFDIQPDGATFFFDNNYPNIVGHRDIDCTSCPGRNLYPELPALRAQAQAQFLALGGNPDPIMKATYLNQSEQPVAVNSGGTKEVWVDFRNDGNVTWRNYKTTTLAVAPQKNVSDFYVASWDSTSEVAKLTTPNVAPGEIGRFVFPIKAPAGKLMSSEDFTISYGGQVLENTQFTVTAIVGDLPYAAMLESDNTVLTTYTKSLHTSTIKIVNKGTQTWRRGEVKLQITDMGDLGKRKSMFYTDKWPKSSGMFNFSEAEVASGGTATFTVPMRSPTKVGSFTNIYKLISSNEIVQDEILATIKVMPAEQAKYSSSTIPVATLNVWRPKVVMKFKNSGTTTWNRNMVLKITNSSNKISTFRDKTWISSSVAARLKEVSVKPGQIGTFVFYLKPPIKTGLYRNNYMLYDGNNPVYGGTYSKTTRVDKAKK